MKNWFGYLYNFQKVVEQNKQQNSRPLIDNEQLIELQNQIENIQQYFTRIEGNAFLDKHASEIDNLIGTIKGLLQFIAFLKEKMHEQQQKIADYDRMKSKLQNHHNIVDSIQQTYETQIRSVYNQKNELQRSFKQECNQLRQKQQRILQELKRLKQINAQDHLRIVDLVNQNKFLAQKNQKIQRQNQEKQNKLQSILQIKRDSKPKVVNLQAIKLTQIFYYKKLRMGVLKYLKIADVYRLRILNKQMNYIIDNSIKTEVLANLMKSHKKQVILAKQDVRFYQKIYQQFAQEKIRQNAIKYLFFKIKPGQYMLPLFQKDFNKSIQNAQLPLYEKEEVEPALAQQKQKIGSQKSIKGTFKSLFNSNKPKQQTNQSLKNQNKFTLDMLKNQKQFKNIEKKVDQFFQKIFCMQLPSDLQNFNFTMREQLNEIKEHIQQHNKSLQDLSALYCFSKFLYLEANQMNTLLQTCFGLLIQTNLKMRTLQNQLQNKVENQRAMRNMVQELIHDKNSMEKRIWSVQNEILRNKQQNTKMKSAINQFQSINVENFQKIEKLNNQIEGLKQNNEQLKKRKKDLENNFNMMREQLKSWQQQ